MLNENALWSLNRSYRAKTIVMRITNALLGCMRNALTPTMTIRHKLNHDRTACVTIVNSVYGYWADECIDGVRRLYTRDQWERVPDSRFYPCPQCTSAPIVDYTFSNEFKLDVTCSNKQCTLGMSSQVSTTIEEAIAKWNQTTTDD